jgi:uncharacterized SAM-binding protein YcdF (DUF218 family)
MAHGYCRRVRRGNGWAIVVPGHSSRGEPSTRCASLVASAAALAEQRRPDLIVFTGGSRRNGGRTEAEEMLLSWPGRRDVELVVEPTAKTTAENASRSLPLLLERGIGEATILCAPLHALRVRYIFARLYESAGIRCEVHSAPVPLTPAAAAWELGAALVLRRQLKAARAELDARG